MGSSIYTRKGDTGKTSLVNGERVDKYSARVEAYGTVDECNSWVGTARVFNHDPWLDSALEFLQHRMFNCSSNLATPEGSENKPPVICQDDVDYLEQTIDRFEQSTGPLNKFILPGGSKPSGFLHVARTVCRRAERRIASLAAHEPVDPLVQKFINRSSDFLFAASRYANFINGQPDVFWNPGTAKPI